MRIEVLIQKIEQAAKDKATTLNLHGKELTELPSEIGLLTNLVELTLSYNDLISLPPEIGKLTNLIKLDLYNNQLRELPSEIRQLTNLRILELRNNKLAALPPEIGQLKNLIELYIGYNSLTELPPEIGQLAKLKILSCGRGFRIKMNPISEEDEDDYYYHHEANKLTILPPQIGQLSNLEKLDLSKNNLKILPQQIDKLTNLKELELEENPLPIPPEILAKTGEPKTIINYYLRHQVGPKKPLNEAKMIFVGQGSVGKTSLIRRLVEGHFDKCENKTEGINITKWRVVVNDYNIRLNVWDFGGQEIMHATHQFFLTKRSLYLLVLDARLGGEENRVEYWLKIIQSFGGDSPVIIVGNKIDQHPLDIDKSGLQNKYENIKAFVETSCQSGHGLNELKEVIAKEVGDLEHINDQLLTTWFSVKDKLENIKKDYLTFPQYVQLCQNEKVTDETSQRTLISFLHDLGIVLNFRDDPRLEDTNILNPKWVTNGVYKILNSNALFQNKGVLERAMLNGILDSRQYPRDKHLFIMDMMRKFELCFDFEGFTDQKFLIPDLLSKEEPFTGDWQGALAFQYHYNVLPNSIISRFIVRMNAQIYQNTYWRTGVVLVHERNKALVKADIEDKKIFIRIDGPDATRRNLLAIIRSQFDTIHKTIAKIEAVEKVPLPNRPDIVVDYKHLLQLEAAGIPSFIPEGLLDNFSITQLLDGIEPEQTRRVRQGSRLREERPAHRPTLQPPVPVEKETEEKLGQIKKQLNLDGQKYAKRIFLLNFGVLVVVATGLALLTYKFGWDTMEPWTYFIGIGAVIGSYAYFALTQQEFSPKAIYERIVEKKKRELHQKFGLN